MILYKGKGVCIIPLLTLPLLALFKKNTNIIDVVKSTSFIDFDQTMVMIYSNFSIDIISITFV
jgi:hypothetical protein